MASTKPARGMRDFLPADVRKRNYVINIIKEVYESYGFEPLETPAVENIETLMGKYGEEGNQLVFKILKRGEKLDLDHATSESDLSDLALRYDLTVPLARVVANNKNDLPKFFKRYQIQPVWRADRPARGRFREFYQCDVDCIGSESIVVEAELIFAVTEILRKLGFKDFTIRINHRGLLTAILSNAGIAIERHAQILVILDKIDKIGREGVDKEFGEIGLASEVRIKALAAYDLFRKGFAREELDGPQMLALVEFLRHQADLEYSYEQYKESSDVLIRAEELGIPKNSTAWARAESALLTLRNIWELREALKNDEDGVAALNQLLRIWNFANSLGPGLHVRLDPSLARGLSYYTGTIMEVNVPDLAGSLGGGGRYDGLIGMFGKEQIPACGFSLGLERILVVMEERGMFDKPIAEGKLKLDAADVMVTIWDEESIPASLKLAADLRKQGIRVTVYPEAEKLGKQFKYADAIGVPFVCVLGDDEAQSGKVKLKNMTSGEEWTLRTAEIGKKIKT